jgi:hypothetical protein
MTELNQPKAGRDTHAFTVCEMVQSRSLRRLDGESPAGAQQPGLSPTAAVPKHSRGVRDQAFRVAMVHVPWQQAERACLGAAARNLARMAPEARPGIQEGS